MSETGYIKYKCNWIQTGPLPETRITILNQWRNKLRNLQLIGSKGGIGYGNISERTGDSNQFVISGSNTGHLEYLDGTGYTSVINYDFLHNTLSCEGPIRASSESLTHAAVYSSNPRVKGVIHVHSLKLWLSLIDKYPTTSREVEYGTPEMAAEMIRVLKEQQSDRGIVVMGGHREGIIAFGRTLSEAGELILQCFCNPEKYPEN